MRRQITDAEPAPQERLKPPACRFTFSDYIEDMNFLTKQEQLVLCVIAGLLLTGWLVEMYRTAHPPPAIQAVNS
jgi:hypothetical protein